jgi:hypothetical protein
LDALVAAGELASDIAEALYAASPFHSNQRKAREGKFWMTSHPTAIDDLGVEPLLAHWGGEAASMWTHDPALRAPLALVGTPSVVELAVPMGLTRDSYWAGVAVVATFGRSLGCIPDKHAFSLYTIAPLPHDAIIEVHREGEASFATMGRGYPARFVDVAIGRWKELTGEED